MLLQEKWISIVQCMYACWYTHQGFVSQLTNTCFDYFTLVTFLGGTNGLICPSRQNDKSTFHQ